MIPSIVYDDSFCENLLRNMRKVPTVQIVLKEDEKVCEFLETMQKLEEKTDFLFEKPRCFLSLLKRQHQIVMFQFVLCFNQFTREYLTIRYIHDQLSCEVLVRFRQNVQLPHTPHDGPDLPAGTLASSTLDRHCSFPLSGFRQ